MAMATIATDKVQYIANAQAEALPTIIFKSDLAIEATSS